VVFESVVSKNWVLKSLSFAFLSLENETKN
jgi:hypothetical protein